MRIGVYTLGLLQR